jgi:RNAse (barnase) inhibitor barstar
MMKYIIDALEIKNNKNFHFQIRKKTKIG